MCAEAGSLFETSRLLTTLWGWSVTVPALDNAFRRFGIRWMDLVDARNTQRLQELTNRYVGASASAPVVTPQVTAPALSSLLPKVDAKPEVDREFLRYAPISVPAPKTKTSAKAASGIRRGAIIADVHVPYHHQKAWPVALGILKDWNPSFGVIVGDFGDLESLSRHPKSKPDLVRLASEYYAMNVELDALQEATPNTSWTYLEGNHENRALRYGNEQGTFDGMLTVPEQLYITPKAEGYHRSITGNLRGMTWIPETEVYKTSFAAFHHGSFSSAMHHAAWHANTFGPNKCPGLPIFYGHNHSSQLFQSGSGVFARCCGWLGDVLRVPQDKKGRPRPWVNGLVLLEVCGDVMSHQFVRITNGCALYSGKFWVADELSNNPPKPRRK